MSRYRRVFVVFRKELIDTLRDRRTLIAMVLAPIVLYPVLMVVLVEALRTEKTRRQSERYQVCVGSEEDRAWLEAVLKRDRQDVEATSAASDAEPESESLGATLRAEQIDVTALSASKPPS
jgi:sodium transport system permease protein